MHGGLKVCSAKVFQWTRFPVLRFRPSMLNLRVGTMHGAFILGLLTLFTSIANAQALRSEVLSARSYTLRVWSKCQEGEVDCSHLSGELAPTGSGSRVELTGSTQMVKCADNVTPCHVGNYRLSGSGFTVLAYPDGTLEVTRPTGQIVAEKGHWQ
jgi:hypothetical protein